MAGRQKFGPDSIGSISQQSSTVVQLSASTITLGGLQYDTASLQCSTVISGVGGLDSGSITSNTLYYVYAILDSGDVALITSSSNQSPTGHNTYKKVGAFFTGASTSITEAFSQYQQTDRNVLSATTNISGGFRRQMNFNWADSFTNNGTGTGTLVYSSLDLASQPTFTGGSTSENSPLGCNITFDNITATQCTVNSNRVDNGARENRDQGVTLHKQGVDVIPKIDWADY